jgi:serine/threonine protein kinase
MSASHEKVETLFHQALKFTPAERPAFLAGACGEDDALRRKLEDLLKAEGEAGAFLPEAPRDAVTLKAEPQESGEEAIGSRISRYKLLEKLGEGGFGEVWLAEQKEPVRRKVALKIIKLGMDTKQVIARFEAERQALALMDHPNIAKVLDAGSTDQGRPYFVMDLVRGIPITKFCDENSMPTRERLDLFITVCQAVQHAHQKGIIHRDLKPANVLVTLHDGVPVPKVIDFGIAKATQGELTDKTIHTQFQQFIGTPAYVSPEQAGMSGLDIDTRSDIYSLGVLLYEMLTGKTPFESKELLMSGLEEMRRTLREKEPVRPSTKLATLPGEELTTTAKRRSADTAKLLHQVQGDLDWIVMKCLEKDRSRRYETANGLAADLKRHLANEPVVARPPSATYRFQKAFRRNKLAFSAAAAVAVVLVLGVVVSTWQTVRATRAEKVAKERLGQVAAERDAKEEARRDAEAISTFLTEVFQSPDPSRDGRTITVAESLDKAAQKLETDLAGQPIRKANLEAALANTYRSLGLAAQAIPLLEKARDTFLATLGPQHPATLSVMGNLAIALDKAGRWNEALKLDEQVLALRRKVQGAEHPDTLATMNSLANLLQEAGRNGEAVKLSEDVVNSSRKVNGPEHHATLNAMANLAICLHEAGQRNEALKMAEQVLVLSRKVNGPEHLDTLGAMANLGNFLREAGRRDEALKLHEEMLALSRKVNGPEHPNTLSAMHNLANSLQDAGRQEQALQLRQEVLSLRRKVNGPEHPETLKAMSNLGNSLREAGRRDEALKLREEVLALSRKVNGAEHPDTLGAMARLSSSMEDASRHDEALKLREEVLSLSRKVNGPEHPDTLGAMAKLSSSLEEASRHDEALKLREEVLSLSRTVNGPEHPDTFSAMEDLANSLQAAGRRYEELKLREELLSLRRKVNGPEDPDTLSAIHKLANSLEAAGRKEEALKLREELLPLSRKVKGAEYPHTLTEMHNLANSLEEAGRKEEALKLREELLPLSRKVKGPEHPDTLACMHSLVISLHNAGRHNEALKLLQEFLPLARKVYGPTHSITLTAMSQLAELYYGTGHPDDGLAMDAALLAAGKQPDTVSAMRLAALQAWFGKEAEYVTTCIGMIAWATTNGSTPPDFERVAKLATLHPLADSQVQNSALTLARRAVDLGQKDIDLLPWLQLALGMAEYRNGHFPSAEEAMKTAALAAYFMTEDSCRKVQGISGFYCAMSLAREGKADEARRLFSETESKMKSLPADKGNPLAGGADHDDLIVWLSYREAKAALNDLSPSKP